MDHKTKINENEKVDMYQNLAGGQKVWNMKVTVIPIVIVAFGTIPKEWEKGLEALEIKGQVETI